MNAFQAMYDCDKSITDHKNVCHHEVLLPQMCLTLQFFDYQKISPKMILPQKILRSKIAFNPEVFWAPKILLPQEILPSSTKAQPNWGLSWLYFHLIWPPTHQTTHPLYQKSSF